MSQGQTEQALGELKILADEPGKDQLVHVLDYALALQVDNQILKSNKYFLLADKLAEDNDYHSLSKIASSIVLSEEMVQYKGDDFEKLLINTMLMINFSILGEKDSALVEVKKVLQKIDNLKIDKRVKASFLPFIYYLNAIIWESLRKWDDAYIDYMSAYKINPSLFNITDDLYRTALLSGRRGELEKWKKKYTLQKQKIRVTDYKQNSEVILLFQQGWGPRKYPSHRDAILPALAPVASRYTSGRVYVDGVQMKSAQILMNVERASIEALNIQLAPLWAKRVAILASKKAVAYGMSKKDQGLGILTDLLLSVSERADLRQWSLLPRSIQIVRLKMKPGKYDIDFKGKGYGPDKSLCQFIGLELKSNEKKIINCRGF